VDQQSEGSSEAHGETRRLLTVQEASRYLAVSVSTLYGWVWRRSIPFVKIGRAVRFDLRDLEAFIEASKQGYNTRAAGKGYGG
jgi:excisionase family DNA binding protein